MAQWAKAPSVETLVVPGSNPHRANKILFALFLSLFDHSAVVRQSHLVAKLQSKQNVLDPRVI